MQIQVHITTDPILAEIQKKFADYPRTVIPFMRRAAEFAAFSVEREAKILTPVDTGRLRASIATSLGIVGGIGAIVQTNVNYASIVHQGLGRGKNSVPRPFMEQGAKIARPDIEAAYSSQIRKALELLKSN
jgi:phage gpG-like protein